MARKLAAADTPNLWETHKRQSIQDAVIRLMCREGLKSVTMERVAQEVGIAKGTVYLHYRDKQALLDEVKNSALEPLVERMQEVVAMDATVERKLFTYAMRYLTYFDESRDLFRVLLYEREVTRVQSHRYQSDRYRKLVELAGTIVAEGIEDGTLRELDIRMVASMFVESIIAIVNQRLLTLSRTAVDDDAALIAEVFLHGTASPIASETRTRRRSAR